MATVIQGGYGINTSSQRIIVMQDTKPSFFFFFFFFSSASHAIVTLGNILVNSVLSR